MTPLAHLLALVCAALVVLVALCVYGWWETHRLWQEAERELSATIADLARDASLWRREQRDRALEEIRRGARWDRIYSGEAR